MSVYATCMNKPIANTTNNNIDKTAQSPKDLWLNIRAREAATVLRNCTKEGVVKSLIDKSTHVLIDDGVLVSTIVRYNLQSRIIGRGRIVLVS